MKNVKLLLVSFSIFTTLTLGSAHTIAGTLDDATIVAIFDQANMADIATARLGAMKGHSREVRDLANMVANDHINVQQMGRALANELKMLGTPPSGDMSWQSLADAASMLDKLDGRAFDEAYLKYEIAYHTAVIDAINSTLLPNIEGEQLRNLVVKVLPGFQHHLEMTKKTADKLGVKY